MFRSSLMAATAVAVVGALPASADVTAQDVLDAMVTLGGSLGETVEIGSQRREGNTLVVSDLRVAMQGDAIETVGIVPEIRLAETQGTVEMRLAPVWSFATSFDVPVGPGARTERMFGTSRVTLDAARVIVSGTPQDMRFDLDIGALGYVSDMVQSDGQLVSPPMSVTLESITGFVTQSMQAGRIDMRHDLNAETLDIASEGSAGAEGAAITVNGRFEQVAISGTSDTAATPDRAGMGALFAPGNNVTASYDLGPGQLGVTGTGMGADFSLAALVAASRFDLRSMGGLVSYDTSARDLDLTIAGSFMPLPALSFSLAEARSGVTLPLSPTAQPVDAGLRYALMDLMLPDALWDLVDPEGRLPRDPANLRLDLSARLESRIDMLAPDAMLDLDPRDGLPFALHSVTLGTLHANLAGAVLSGEGAADVDPESVAGGMPRAAGQFRFQLDGANRLMTTLGELGLIPAEQAMGYMMMLGMVAVPVGEDSLVSDITIHPDGTIEANGQRLPF